METNESTIVIDDPEAGDSVANEGDESVTEHHEGLVTQEQAEEEWNQLTEEQLKEELDYRELSTEGSKAELVARLIAHEFEMEGQNLHEERDTRHHEEEGDEEGRREGEQEEEMDEENGEGVEFVEWNEGDDAEHDAGEDQGEETAGQDLNESRGDEDGGSKSGKRGSAVEEGDIKGPDGENLVDVSKEKDIFTFNWQGKRLTVPFKSEILKDLEVCKKIQSVVVYPVELEDVFSDVFRKHLEKATETTLRLEETKPGKPSKGLLRLKFLSLGEALDAIEELKSTKEGVTAKHFCPEDSEGVILSQLHREELDRRGSAVFRLLYVGNLPSHVTERSIKEVFPDALQVIMPYDEDSMEKTGYAYLEFKNEEEAFEASEKYKDVEMEGEKLYVIKAISFNREKFGLLRDSLRLYWLEQIQKYRKVIDRSHGRNSWEASEAEQKVNELKHLLDKDKRRREELRLPVPGATDDKKKDEKDEDKEKDKDEDSEKGLSKERRRSSHHSLKDFDRKGGPNRPPQQRRSPFVRRENYRPNRGGRGSGFGPQRRGGDDVANKLVNQLQGLVSALTNKLPDATSSVHGTSHQGSHPIQRRHYPDDHRYGGAGQNRPNYARPSSFYDDQRSGAAYHSSYSGNSYDQSYPSYRGGYRENPTDRYSGRRYRDDGGFGQDRRKRPSGMGGGGYMDQGSSGRYPSSRVVPYSPSSRRGGASNLSGGRQYTRSKPRGSYQY